MYLLVFVTLVIGLLGVYGQILTVQTARVAAGQIGFAQTIQDWHAGAVSMAASVLKGGYAPDNNGCSLTSGGPVGDCVNAAVCGGSGVVASSAGAIGKITIDNTACDEEIHLPKGYKAEYYQFESILYLSASGGRYVLTWVPPPIVAAGNPAPGYVALPSASNKRYQTSMTMADISQQFRNIAKSAPYTYGIVKNSTLKVGSIKTDETNVLVLDYGVPNYVPEGSIGIISSAD